MSRFSGCWVFVLALPSLAVANEPGGAHPGTGLAPWLVTGALVIALAVLGGLRLLRRSGVRDQDTGATTRSGDSRFDPVLPRHYSPLNVGNDASARPWERQGTADLDLAADRTFGQGVSVPEGFDVRAFLRDSEANFIGLQAAWDRADIPALRPMMTEAMLLEIQGQLAERERSADCSDGRSEVVMIDAQLLGIEELADSYMASVEFSGLIREGKDAGPSPFRELWSITRPKAGEGRWLVAGVQALH
jgi:predicted lipid-binding transport protein (Tim44 family)